MDKHCGCLKHEVCDQCREKKKKHQFVSNVTPADDQGHTFVSNVAPKNQKEVDMKQ